MTAVIATHDLGDVDGRGGTAASGATKQRAPRPRNPLHAASLPLLTVSHQAKHGRSPTAARSPSHYGEQLREELRARNAARREKPPRPKAIPVWLPKKMPLSEKTIRRIKVLLNMHSTHGQIAWPALEDVSLKLGIRPDEGMQMLFRKFVNENTGMADIPTVLRLLYPQIEPRTLNAIYRQMQSDTTGETVEESTDWNDKWMADPEARDDLLHLFTLYARQEATTSPRSPRGPADPPGTATLGAHIRALSQPPGSGLPPLTESRTATDAGAGRHPTRPPSDDLVGAQVFGQGLSGGISKGQVRACFTEEEIPDDWIDAVFEGTTGYLSLEAFAQIMEGVLLRRREPQGNLRLYFQQ